MTLLKESRGRRLMPASPDASLFLTKATGKVPHGGGKKLEPAGEEYKVLRRWIAAGMPYGEPTDPTIRRLSFIPNRASSIARVGSNSPCMPTTPTAPSRT